MEAKALSSFCISVLWISLAAPEDTDFPRIQLFGSDKRCQGIVQVWMEDTWFSLCRPSLDRHLSDHICRMQSCGKPTLLMTEHALNVSTPFLNITCGPKEDGRNCSVSKVAEEECPGAAVLNCSEQKVLRLAGSSGPCAGRVEIFMDGVWGSACHDGWDALDAEVTCRQLRCGSALSALGGSPFGSGPPRIHLNGVKCRGSENFLWECEEIGKQECSAGEHAGVICAEHRDVRLSGGANNCSGRVEIYLHGVWATVCDTHWFNEDSNMFCNYLGCGSFQNETKHDHSPSMYASVICSKLSKTPWDCAMYKKRVHMCQDSKAVGLICQAGVIDEAKVNESGTIGITNADTAPGLHMVHVVSQYLVIACAALLALLLASIVISTVIILRLQKQKKISIQKASLPKSKERWNSKESKEPGEEAVTLPMSSSPLSSPSSVTGHYPRSVPSLSFDFSLQIPTLGPAPSPRFHSKEPVPAAIPLVPTITTTLEDEEDYGFSSAPPMPLVTFQEEKESQGAAASGPYTRNQLRRLRSASHRTSSTSSEEENWYMNYRQQPGDQNFLCPLQPYEGSSEYDDVSSIASD